MTSKEWKSNLPVCLFFYYIGKFAVKPPGYGNMEDCYERKNEVIWF